MSVYEVKVKATITETIRVIAENEYEAAERAEMIFRNDNGNELLDTRFVIRSNEPSTQHPAPSTQHPAPSTQH